MESSLSVSAGAGSIPVYSKEGKLFAISLVISTVVWVALIAGTMGIALLWLLALFVAYLFVQSAFIAYLKGNAIRITPAQFPALHARIERCAARVGLQKVPEAYLLNGEGLLNALATRFLGRDFLVLFSDVVDALAGRPDAIDFYIGHELGHIHRKHLIWGPVLWPASVLPLLGAASSRAREYTCDAYGQACCANPEDAAAGLAMLAAGPQQWRAVDIGQYAAQSRETGGFWMSFHELVSDYPWLVKRMERVRAHAAHVQPNVPGRSLFAWILALFVPRLGVGQGGAGLVVTIAAIGVLAAVALPAYNNYLARAESLAVFAETGAVERSVTQYIIEHQAFPASLAEAGLTEPYTTDRIANVTINEQQLIFRLSGHGPIADATVIYQPYVEDGKLYWDCSGGTLPAQYRSEECR